MAEHTRHHRGTALQPGFVRDLHGVQQTFTSAAATRRRDLAAVLGFGARRRLAASRHAELPQRPGRSPDDGGMQGDGAARHSRSGDRSHGSADRSHGSADRSQGSANRPRGAAAPGEGARLQSRTRVGTSLLKLAVSKPPGFEYQPGQHVKLGLSGLMRTYSLVSAPHQDHLEFFIEVFPRGRLSQRLGALATGAAMALGTRARGTLSVDERYPNQLMVATVTGIAPYLSLLRHHLRTGTTGARRFVILHGASFGDELGYADELGALASRHSEAVAYLPTVSRPESPRNAGWSGLVGRVESHLDAVLARYGLTPANTAGFACGQPDMVRNVAAELRRRGFTTYTEIFD